MSRRQYNDFIEYKIIRAHAVFFPHYYCVSLFLFLWYDLIYSKTTTSTETTTEATTEKKTEEATKPPAEKTEEAMEVDSSPEKKRYLL